MALVKPVISQTKQKHKYEKRACWEGRKFIGEEHKRDQSNQSILDTCIKMSGINFKTNKE